MKFTDFIGQNHPDPDSLLNPKFDEICKLAEEYAQALQLLQPDVSGSLQMYDVEELNEIVTDFNNKEMSMFDFVGRVWNKAYNLGCVYGSKRNDR